MLLVITLKAGCFTIELVVQGEDDAKQNLSSLWGCYWLCLAKCWERERQKSWRGLVTKNQRHKAHIISPSERILNVSLLPEMSESRWTGPTVRLKELRSSDKEAWTWAKRPEAPTSILSRKWLCTAVRTANTPSTHFGCDQECNRTVKTSQRKSCWQEVLGLPHTLEMSSWSQVYTDGLVTC